MFKIDFYRYLLITFICCLLSIQSKAQQNPEDDLINLKLPPIDSLFESAKNSSMIEFYNYRMEGQELALKTERRSWLQYFKIAGTYQYGVMGMNSYTDLGSNYPIIYEDSGGEQIWYNFGATLSIPLDKLFDRKNRINTQKLKIKETLKERDMWYDDQKTKIINLYYKTQSALNTLRIVVEQSVIADAQYEIATKDYIGNAITAQALTTAKSLQVQSHIQMEELKSALKISLLQLEILSNKKLLNNK